MNDIQEITSSLDQPAVDFLTYTELQDIDKIFEQSLQERDIYIISKFIKQKTMQIKLAGWSLAKILYLLNTHWEEFEIQEDFENLIMQEFGISNVTASRYIRAWSLFAEKKIPEQLQAEIQSRPIKDVIAIANTVKQGYELSKDDWENLAYSPDNKTVLGILRDIKGEEPRSNQLTIVLKRNGDLYAYQNDQSSFLGYFDLGVLDDIKTKALERIINNTGIVKE